MSLVWSLGALAESILITNVTVLPMTTQERQDGRNVLIEDGRIVRIGKRVKVDSETVRMVDGSGKFLMPGLWDMHVHVSGNADAALPMFLASGVTGIRDMGGDPDILLPLRDAIEGDKRLGPRLRTAGAILEDPVFIERMKTWASPDLVERARIAVAQPEEAAEVVQRQKEQGVDFIKVRTCADRQTLAAISKAAEDAGLPLTGHADLPYAQLLKTSQISYEHFPRDLLRRSDASERREVWRTMAEWNIVVVPIAVNFTQMLMLPLDEVERQVLDAEAELDPRRKYVSKALLESWAVELADRKESIAPDFDTMFERSFSNLREAHAEGVRILAGTDDGVMLMYSGFSLHDELQVLVEQLQTDPIDILRNATIHSAQILGLDDRLGTIEVGKEADLILLNANPLDAIQNTTKIGAVMVRGRYLDRGALDEMLEDVAKQAAD